MNNSKLDAILKRARTPERSEESLEDFTRQVVSQLTRDRTEYTHVDRRWFPKLAWGLATAICVAAAFTIGHWRGRMASTTATANDVLQNVKFVRETLEMFPNQVRAIVQDNNGLNLVLSSNSDVPASPPIYVRICDGKHCASCVTFSGQEIQIAGLKVTVLSDAHGGVILMGNHFVWSSQRRIAMGSGMQIEAKNLGQL